MKEVAVANWAAALHTADGHPVSPRVVGIRSGRPSLEQVPGPRLDTRLQGGEEAVHLVGAAARTLAAVHTATPPAALHDTVTFEHPLWDPVPLETHLGLSTAQRRILGELHTDEDLRSRGRLIRDRVRRRSVPCHGDARTANFCVVAPRTPVLIDWETAGWGSPAGDLAALCGSLFADLLVGTAAPAGTGSRASSRASLAAAVERWTASVRAALAEYRHAAGACPDAEGLLGPAVGCALLVRAFVRAAYTTYDRQVACLYEIGASLLRAPERWRTIDVQR
ncbi:phosphotransferase [Streptomyces sp. NPDC001966]